MIDNPNLPGTFDDDDDFDNETDRAWQHLEDQDAAPVSCIHLTFEGEFVSSGDEIELDDTTAQLVDSIMDAAATVSGLNGLSDERPDVLLILRYDTAYTGWELFQPNGD